MLTGGRKTLAILVIVVGSLVLLSSLSGIGTAAYTLATGKVPLEDTAKNFTKMMANASAQKSLAENYNQMIDVQMEAQRKLAPLQLVTLIPYALATAALVILAAMMLAGRDRRVWLARMALLTCLVRVGYTYVHYRLVAPTTEAMKETFGRSAETIGEGLPPEQRAAAQDAMKTMSSAVGSATHITSIISVFAYLFLIGGFWGLVAFVFSKEPKPAAGPAPGPVPRAA